MPEPRFERALAAAGMCVWRWDSVADTASCSDACADLFGLPHGTRLTYDELLSVVHPNDRGPLKAAVQRALAGDGEYEVEYRVVWRDGTERWIAAKGRAELDSSNNPLLVEGVAQDITERKRGEAALRASEERFRTLAESAPIGIFLTRATGECTYVNATWTAISGLSVEGSLDYGWMRVVHPDDRARLEETWPAAAASAAKREIDYRIITPTGTVQWLHTLVTPQFDGAGSLVGYVGSVEDITERKRAEGTVREWRDRYEAVIRASGQVLYDWDARTDHVVYGGDVEKTLGYDLGEMAGGIARWLSIVHPEDLAKSSAQLKRPLGTKTTSRLEYRLRRRDGRYLMVRDDGLLILNAAGEVVRAVGLVADITEGKRAEEELRQRGNQLSLIADNIPDLVSRVDRDLRYLFASASYERWFGVPSRAILGRTLREFIGEETFARAAPYIDRALNGERVTYENRFKTPSGTLRFSVITLVPDVDTGGNVQGLFIFVQDITEQKRVEHALAEAEARLRLALQAGRIGTWDWDMITGKIIWSRGHEELWGMAPGTFNGSYEAVDASLQPEDRAGLNRAVAQAIADRSTFRHEFRVVWPDRSVHWIASQGEPSYDAAGKPVRMIGVVMDITERKRAEEERLRLAAQLRQAQKMEALGTLAGGIAHDFNNVLAAIAGNAQLALADSPLGSPVRTSLTEIERAAARAGKLVRQILAFSRRDEAERRPLALAPVVEEALKLLRATVPAMIEIRAELAAELPEVFADATQIHQILMNLGGNAAHAIGDRRGMLEVRLAAVAIKADAAPVGDLHPGRYVHLSVSDTGCGIDAATLERIFDPFFTTKGPGQGTGLGLSVVHGIVQSYGGAITVESALGAGTTFHLYFPEVAEAIGDVAALTAPTVTQGHGEHVLYVDDEEALVFLAKRMLKRLGYRVTAYEVAEQALQAFRAQPQDFDLVVTDLSMPGMSGRDLARELLRIRPDVSIVLMSGYVRQEDIDTAKRLGIREVVLKPNTVGELSEVLRRLLRAPAQD